MEFKDYALREEILRAVSDCGYEKPTPVQAEAIPHILEGEDLIGLAQTGTGKTAGFILPMLEILSKGRAKARMPRSLVLVPTRELAAQVAENFDNYGANLRLTKALLTGGVSINEQMKLLDRGVDVLIATPGRLLDLFGRGNILLNGIEILVIDEADRMLDMGFIPDIDRIIALISGKRQTSLFSATMPLEIQKLAGKYMHSPVQVSVSRRSSVAETVEQYMVRTEGKKKRNALMGILAREDVSNAFIFLNRKRDVENLGKWLSSKRFPASPLHGDMLQSERNKTLAEFKEGKIKYLVCSDVAGRGLDVEAVSHVINYDVPYNAEDYVHRIGRTGRAGMVGQAWTIVTPEEKKLVDAIIRLTGKELEIQPDKEVSYSDFSKKPERSQKAEKAKKSTSRNKVKSAEKSGRDKKKHAPKEGREDITGFGDHLPAFFESGKRR
jgi:superfamily II DNA/RNA helicase